MTSNVCLEKKACTSLPGLFAERALATKGKGSGLQEQRLARDRAARGSAAETGSGAISGRGSHLAVRQQEWSRGMLPSVAAYSGADRDLAMEPHSAVGPLQLRFSPYAFNGG